MMQVFELTSGFTRLDVIKPGLLVRSPAGVILDARSTVTLIRTAENNILVDTSLKKDIPILLQSLKACDLTPEDINIIINTHCHRDHTANNRIFPSACIYTHKLCTQIPTAVKIDSFPYILEKNIEIIETPGHSWDSISIVVRLEEVYVIAGDAIPIKGNYENWIPPIVHVDAEQALASMQHIKEIADIIIPGHDKPFAIKNI